MTVTGHPVDLRVANGGVGAVAAKPPKMAKLFQYQTAKPQCMIQAQERVMQVLICQQRLSSTLQSMEQIAQLSLLSYPLSCSQDACPCSVLEVPSQSGRFQKYIGQVCLCCKEWHAESA